MQSPQLKQEIEILKNQGQELKTHKSGNQEQNNGVLPFQQTQYTIEHQQQSPDKFYVYFILGSFKRMKSQTSTLVRRMEEAKSQEPAEDEFELKQPVLSRFYNSQIKCFRCQKIGHHNSYCPYKGFCYLCLSFRHVPGNCPQKVVCFRCSGIGHQVKSCKVPQGLPCKKCNRKHFDKCGFLAMRGSEVKQLVDTYYTKSDQRIICISCRIDGHLNCAWNDQHM